VHQFFKADFDHIGLLYIVRKYSDYLHV